MKSFWGQVLLGIITITGIIFIPAFFLGSDYYLTIHDNLDSEVSNLAILKESGMLLQWSGDTLIPQIFNGLPRWYIHSEFSFIRVLFYFFDPFWAYLINSALVRVIGFFGILILARDHFKGSSENWKIFLVALTFSILPIYPIYGISVMGQPLLLWAVLNLQKSRVTIPSIFVMLLFPFYSHIAFVGPFSLLIAVCYGFWILVTSKKWPSRSYFLGFFALLFGFVLANKSMIWASAFGEVESHRTEIVLDSSSITQALRDSGDIFLNGQYHSSKFFGIVFLLLAGGVLYFSKYKKALIGLLAAIFAISILYGFSGILSAELGQYITAFKTFQFNRFTFFLPLLFFMIPFSVALEEKIPKWVVFVFVGIQFTLLFTRNNEIYPNFVKLFEPESGVLKGKITYREFYAEEAFSQLKKDIPEAIDSFRVVSLGMYPAVSQFNGFYTLDSYQNLYPLAYKKAFRPLISDELSKDEALRKYYDSWGHRCYFYSAELWNSCKLLCGSEAMAITNLQFDKRAFVKMGGLYIISAVEIQNANELGLHLIGTYPSSKWNIRLYKL